MVRTDALCKVLKAEWPAGIGMGIGWAETEVAAVEALLMLLSLPELLVEEADDVDGERLANACGWDWSWSCTDGTAGTSEVSEGRRLILVVAARPREIEGVSVDFGESLLRQTSFVPFP